MMTGNRLEIQVEQDLTFRLLVGYRWISLILPLIWLILAPQQAVSRVGSWWTLLCAAGLTLLLTLTVPAINRWLLHHPWLLVFDLLFAALLVWYTDVERSPYYLYSLAPILAAAFFFRIRGGLLAAAIYTLFYLLGLTIPHLVTTSFDILGVLSQVVSFFLIGTIFGYPSLLLGRLHHAHTELTAKNNELAQRNRDLDLMQELSLIMQSSVDPTELQESILRGLVQDMGYPSVLVGLYDERLDALTSWLSLSRSAEVGSSAQIAHTALIPLAGKSGLLARALKDRLIVEITDGEAPTAETAINDQLKLGSHYLILPLSLRGYPIGLILINGLPPDQRLSTVERMSLDHLTTHAGVALGSLRLCIDRAQRQAIIEERQRIAVDLHDNVSQALYGTAYSLEACIQLLPSESQVRAVLTQLHTTIGQAQAQMRQAIFDIRGSDQITMQTFTAGLHQHLQMICPVGTLALQIDLPGDFDQWDALTRHELYRIAQEALANAAKHAQAQQIIIKLSHDKQQIELRVADDGEGFNPAEVNGMQHLGLQSMSERVQALGGAFELHSAFGEGTLIITQVPYLETGTTRPVIRNGPHLVE